MSSSATTGNCSVSKMVLVAPEAFELREDVLATRRPGWARVKVSYTGICGSDFPIVSGQHPRAVLPLVMGHEITGVVLESDSGPPPGTRVAINPLLHCGNCGACQARLTHLCRSLRLLGIDAPGSLAEVMEAPDENLFPFADTTDAVSAAWAEPLAVAVHAVRRSNLTAGESALIFGAGPIGLLVALVARHYNAGTITIAEPAVQRREVAESLGFSTVAPEDLRSARARADSGPDVVFDCAGHPKVAPLLTDVAPVRGRIVIVAVHHRPELIDLRELAFAEQQVSGVRVYERGDFGTAVRLIDEGALPLVDIPVVVYPLSHIAAAVDEARSGRGAVKILVASEDPSNPTRPQ